MNEYDSNRIYDLMANIGFNKTNTKAEADCFLLNTCHIREKATEKVYHEIGRLKKSFNKYFFRQVFYFLIFVPYNSNLWSTSL